MPISIDHRVPSPALTALPTQRPDAVSARRGGQPAQSLPIATHAHSREGLTRGHSLGHTRECVRGARRWLGSPYRKPIGSPMAYEKNCAM